MVLVLNNNQSTSALQLCYEGGISKYKTWVQKMRNRVFLNMLKSIKNASKDATKQSDNTIEQLTFMSDMKRGETASTPLPKKRHVKSPSDSLFEHELTPSSGSESANWIRVWASV